MRRMNDFERQLYHTIVHNSLLFLEDGLKRLITGSKNDLNDTIVLSCTNIQISLRRVRRVRGQV